MSKITELIKVVEKDGRKVVSARNLYEFLGASERFANWFKRQLQFGFVENQDYLGCKVFNTLAKQELQDYEMTLGMAKEVSMIQRTDKGKEARQYFIDCEKQLEEITHVIREQGEVNLEDLNKIRFSERRIKNNFANCPYKDIETLVEEFKDYAFDLDTKTRIARCRSVIKGLRELHDKLALLTTNNIGNCYNIINIIADVNELEHKTENNRNGGIRAGLRRKLNKCS